MLAGTGERVILRYPAMPRHRLFGSAQDTLSTRYVAAPRPQTRISFRCDRDRIGIRCHDPDLASMTRSTEGGLAKKDYRNALTAKPIPAHSDRLSATMIGTAIWIGSRSLSD